MPDSPDYQKYLPSSSRFSLQDMSELAVRINAPLMLDRRGEIVWYDDFRNGLANWKSLIVGAGGSVALYASQSYHKGFYVSLIAGTTSSKQTYIRSNLGNFVLGRLGFDVVFNVINSPIDIQAQFDIYDGSFLYEAYLKYKGTTHEWQVLDDGSSFITILTRQINFGTNIIWFPIKLVYDLSTQNYIRFIVGNTETNINTIRFRKTVNTSTPQMQLTIAIDGDGTLNGALNIAQAIITQAEP